MSLLSRPWRSPRTRSSSLPELEKVGKRRKSRSSDDGDYSEDDDDDDDEDEDEFDSTTPVSRCSTPRGERTARSYPSISSKAYNPPKGAVRRYRRFGGLYFYRVSNRTTRYLAVIIIASIVIFILSLVRASQVENWKILHGKLGGGHAPPQYAWMQFPLFTRYYGGIDTLMLKSENRPEFPGSLPLETPQTFQAGEKLRRATPPSADEAEVTPTQSSKPFGKHPKSVPGGAAEDDTVECFIDIEGSIRVPSVRYYDGRPLGFPDHAIGSYEELNLPDDICFERYGKYGPYGFGYSARNGGMGTGKYGHRNGSESVFEDVPPVDYRNVDWADVQRRCYKANARRFEPVTARPPSVPGFYIQAATADESIPASEPETAPQDDQPSESDSDREPPSGDVDTGDSSIPVSDAISEGRPPAASKASVKRRAKADSGTEARTEADIEVKTKKLSRTAVVVRVWDEYAWREDDIMNLRSIIVETAMASHGRYDVHLLVQVKNDAAHPVLADSGTYESRIRDSIPAEFRGLVTLWTETQMLSLYQGLHDVWTRGPDLPVHGSFRGLSMALMYFAHNHPEYDYFWQWEMDARYTGHHLDLFAKVENWARDQPRKGLWERNERFYVPDAHGSWEEFKQMSKIQGEMDTDSADNFWKDFRGNSPHKPSEASRLVWGPQRPGDESDWFETENDPEPPAGSTPDQDRYEWGVGEEADMISLYPIYDPVGTTWALTDDITGYNTRLRDVPRRAHINVSSRVSRRLLMMMHRETAFRKHFAFPEMWQGTVAFQHGLKAVAAPQPMYTDRNWPPKFLAQTLNAGKNGASGGARAAVYGQREHNLQGLSWFYNSHFAPILYQRWLGLRYDDAGGEEFEMVEDPGRESLRGGEGRMCLPPMLLHPVKEVVIPVEAPPPEEELEEIAESDPAA